MSKGKKVSRGYRYYEEDLDRIKKLCEPRESITDFIEMALIHEFEIREGKVRVSRMSSLA